MKLSRVLRVSFSSNIPFIACKIQTTQDRKQGRSGADGKPELIAQPPGPGTGLKKAKAGQQEE